MQAPNVDLFDWLLHHAAEARYNLAFSNIHGITFEEFQRLTNFSFPPDFNLGINQQYGAPELKETLRSIYKSELSNIVTTTGASEANFLLFSSLLTNGDECIIEQPGYPPIWLAVEMLGARRINWPRAFDRKFKLDLESLPTLCTKKTKVIVLTNLHNPSGVYTDAGTIKAVAEIAGDHGAYVLVDELFLDGSQTRHSSCYGPSNVIVTSSATKIYGFGGLHTGWMIAPEELAARCQRMKAYTTGASSFVSEIMTAALLKHAREAVITRFQQRAMRNSAVVKEWMTQHGDLLRWVEPDGGLVCFPKYSLKISSIDLCKYLFETQKVLVNPGTYFNSDGFIRLSYWCETDTLRDGLEALAKGLDAIRRHE
jgi:aspartate/methionine/tyrosine aminotransferase